MSDLLTLDNTTREQLKASLNDTAKALSQEVASLYSSAKGFMQEQVPLVVKEYLQWMMAKCLFYMVLGTIIVIAGLVLTRIIKKSDSFDSDLFGLVVIGNIVVYVIGSIMFLTNAYSLLQIWIAPRVFLIEWLASLVVSPNGGR